MAANAAHASPRIRGFADAAMGEEEEEGREEGQMRF